MDGIRKGQTTLEWAITQKRLTEYMDSALETVSDELATKIVDDIQKGGNIPEKIEENVTTAVEKVESDIPISIIPPLIKSESIFPLIDLSGESKDQEMIHPFAYQTDALKSALQEAVGTIVMPTGSGKTILGAMIIKAFWERNRQAGAEDIKTLVITPQITILTQWLDTFKKAGTQATAYYGEEKNLSELTVTTYQSASAHPELLNNFNSIIFDEVHHVYAPEYSVLINEESLNNKYFIIGLSATALKPSEMNYKTQEEIMPVIYELTPIGLAEYGRATIPKWISVRVTPTSRVENAIDQTESFYRRIVSRYGNFYDMTVASRKKDYMALRGMKLFYYRSLLLSATHDKLLSTVEIIKMELDSNPDAKAIVFTESGQSANFIGNLLSKYGIGTLILLSEKGLKADEKREELDKFRKGIYRVLVGVNMIVEGLDVPEVDQAFMVSMSKKSERRFVQKLGRILRYKEGKKPKVFTITYRGTTEVDTMSELLNNTLNKKEPDEIRNILPTDISNIKEEMKAANIEIEKDEALEEVSNYLAQYNNSFEE